MARWFAMSTDFLADPKIEALGEEHGPAGPLAVVALLARAKRQNQEGHVTASIRTLAHEAFTDRETVARIVTDAAEVGLVTLVTESDREITVTFPSWSRWQAAGKKARQREEKQSESPPGSGECPPNVPGVSSGSPPTEQDSTEQNRKNNVVGKPADPPLTTLLAQLVEKNTGRKPRTGKRWHDAERLLLESDKRDPVQAERLLRWSQDDEFWRANILSMPKFREKYDQLLLAARRVQEKRKGRSAATVSTAERRGTASQHDADLAWAKEHLPDIPAVLVVSAIGTVRLGKGDITPENVRGRLAATGRLPASGVAA